MLKSLSIKNLSLIEDAEVSFGPHFNVITGETGAGKSSFLRALSFALGERADSSYVRKNASKASIVAVFEKEGIQKLLEELGIETEGATVIIKREISPSGTSRAFINNQLVLLSALEKVAGHLINFSSQQAHFALLQKDSHQQILDQFGQIDLSEYQDKWRYFLEKKKEKEQLGKKLAQKEHLLKELRASEKLLEQADLLDEEETLFKEYTRLESRKEIEELLTKMQTAFFSSDKNLLTLSERFLKTSEKIPSLHESLKNIHAEAEELSYNLDKLLSEKGPSPEKLEEQLKTIDRLKTLWSADKNACLISLGKVREEIVLLEKGEAILEGLQGEIEESEKEAKQKAAHISLQRQKAAKALAEAITSQIRSLNMPAAEFHVEITSCPLSLQGAETSEFMLIANLGERKTPLKGFASGGELSRIMLALKTVLAGPRPVLLFDEADSGIGGLTASLVAEKLKTIAEKYQVICITHLPQMAEQAAHHFVIEKFAEEGRTYTKVTPLSTAKEKSRELKRMQGILDRE